MVDLSKLDTEQQNQNTMNLDQMSIKEALTIMNQEDKKWLKLQKVIPEIEEAVKIIIEQFNKERLIYTGAGTSGRLGVLDASDVTNFQLQKNRLLV